MQISVEHQYKKTVTNLLQSFSEPESKELANKLFDFYFELTPVNRVLQKQRLLDKIQTQKCEKSVEKLLRHEPLQYVLGIAYFMDIELAVNQNVLIPRPETEELVAKIIKAEQNNGAINILDIGTGSGCIAIALKKHLPAASVTAIDISKKALKTAKLNAIKNKTNIHFILQDIFAKENKQLINFDVIVSNPPYVTEVEKAQMQANVLDYEPHLALFVPDENPLKYYEQVVNIANTALKPQGRIWFEINENFGKETELLLEKKEYRNIKTFADFKEKNRYLYGEKPSK